MRLGILDRVLPSASPACGMASGQPASARIETVAMRLIEPDPYQVTAVLEPSVA